MRRMSISLAAALLIAAATLAGRQAGQATPATQGAATTDKAAGLRVQAQAAGMRGDVKTQLDLLRQAYEAAPDRPEHLRAYAGALWNVDAARARTLALQFVERFPAHAAARDVLMELAQHADTMPERIRYLERLREQFQESSPALFNAYLTTDLHRAAAVAREIGDKSAPASPLARLWASAAAFVDKAIAARTDIRGKRFADALARLDGPAPLIDPGSVTILNLRRYDALRREGDLLRAEAEAGLQRNESAYARVMDLFLREPGDRLNQALQRYGAALRKAPADVDEDVYARLVANSTPAPDFAIVTYKAGRTGSLSDLRGKLVLLNFWFPG